MSIIILGGKIKGQKLLSPKKVVRPTSVLLKRRLFDSIQNFSKCFFLDLCAGTGAVGLEALSRGADKVFLNEKNSHVFKILKQNIVTCLKSFSRDQVCLSSGDFSKNFIEIFRELSVSHNNIIPEKITVFFDPPYERKDLYLKFKELLDHDLLRSLSEDNNRHLEIIIIIEFCRQKTSSESEMQTLFGVPDKIFKQGTSFLYIYHL